MSKKQLVKTLLCYQCLPAKSFNDHKSLNGTTIHEREDVEKDMIYFLNEKDLKESMEYHWK